MMPDFFTEQHVTARKRHRCGECFAWIEPGEVYERVSGKWDGDMLTQKTCQPCEDARDFYVHELDSPSFRLPDEGQFTFGNVAEELLETARDLLPGTGLKFSAYRHVVGMKKRGRAARRADV